MNPTHSSVPTVMESQGKISGHGKSWKIRKIPKVMENYKFERNLRSKFSHRNGSFQNCPVVNFCEKLRKSQPWKK